jgi:hypothetical protein
MLWLSCETINTLLQGDDAIHYCTDLINSDAVSEGLLRISQ